ncbi:MAG: ATP-binding protein [Stellaceae bacterium]
MSVRRIDPLRLEFSVADTGTGVNEEVAQRLFEPFVTTKPDGMGLGLSISRSIVEAHGSRLRLVQNGGAGAAFAFALPIAAAERSVS